MTTISKEELRRLLMPDVQEAIRSAIDRDPVAVALDSRIPEPRLVATQVKYLRRAQSKLPSYAAAWCIIPSLAFEQSSSEQCAVHKPLEGDRVLDLTCGLGVDAWYLSRHFREIVTLERNPLLAEIARENFRRLGAKNIGVVNCSAEEYVASCKEQFDWIYADPDRRSERGEKLVRLEDCSPDMIALMPRLKTLAPKICIKNSPLFDIDEPRRLFGACRVEVVSLNDECKEVMILLDGAKHSEITATAIGIGRFSAPADHLPPARPPKFSAEAYHWLTIPDVALQKARLARLHLEGWADIWSENGFGFSAERPTEVMGRVFEIEKIEPYDPKQLKRTLKGRGVEIFKRDFPFRIEEVMRRAGCRAGSEIRLAMTKIEDKHWVIRLK